MRRSDLVIVSADRLYQSKAPFNPRTALVRHGVDYAHFRRALDAETVVPEEIAGLPRPVIGFFGLIADWVDVELMASVAERFSTGSLVALGKATTDVSSLERPAQRPSARAQAIQRAPRVLQRFRRRVDAVSRQRADIEREPAQGARISGGGFTGGFDRDPRSGGAGTAAASAEIAKVFCSRSSGRCSTPGRAWSAVRRCVAKVGKRGSMKFAIRGRVRLSAIGDACDGERAKVWRLMTILSTLTGNNGRVVIHERAKKIVLMHPCNIGGLSLRRR